MMQYSLIISKVCKNFKFIVIPAIVLLAHYISANWYQMAMIRGDSMFPAYHNMQIVLIDRHCAGYTYGDVVAFQCDNLNSVLVKRIVGCSGDRVIIKNGTLYINDTISKTFPEAYMFEYDGIARESIYLKENQYFVIGDNLDKSKDSRYAEIGVIYGDGILGKIIPRVSVNEKCHIKVRN